MRIINWLFIIAGTVVMIYVMMFTGRFLKTPGTPLGIINLELAATASRAGHVIGAWAPGANTARGVVTDAIKNTWLDFIFIFFYSLFLFHCCKTIAEAFHGIKRKAGLFLAMAALHAGLLDMAENTGMLFMLHGYISNSIALFTTACSAIKWALALAALLYVVFLGPLYLLRLARK